MSKSKWFVVSLIGAFSLCLSASSPKPSVAAESSPGWQVEWSKTVKAAEEE